MPIGIAKLNGIARNSSGSTVPAVLNNWYRARTTLNPNPNPATETDLFASSIRLSAKYMITGTPGEDNNSGRAYLYDLSNGKLLRSFVNPNQVGSSTFDYFGADVDINESYAIIGAPGENPLSNPTGGSNENGGRAHVYNINTGALLHSVVAPVDPDTNYFGSSVSMGNSYFAVGNYAADGYRGAAYVYSLTTGNLVYTFTGNGGIQDQFGVSVDMNDTHVIVGAWSENISGYIEHGRVYVYKLSDGTLETTIDYPDTIPIGLPDGPAFGFKVRLTERYAAIQTLYNECYFYSAIDWSLLWSYKNNDTTMDICNNYAVISDTSPNFFAHVDIFDIATGTLLDTLTNPNEYSTTVGDNFGSRIAVNDYWVAARASELVPYPPSGGAGGIVYMFSRLSPNTQWNYMENDYVASDYVFGYS